MLKLVRDIVCVVLRHHISLRLFPIPSKESSKLLMLRVNNRLQ